VKERVLEVLIVDDDAGDRLLFEQYLSGDPEYDYRFVCVDTAAEALEACSRHQPDCIIVDHMLPDATGLDLITWICRNQDSLVPAPVIMITGRGDEAIAVQALKAGAQDYMSKAVLTRDAIRRAVRNAVQKAWLVRRINRQRLDLEQMNERMLTANRKLEEVSRLKSEFLANASHELRTPLNSILGFLRLILDGMCTSRDEEHDFIRTAFQSAEMLLNLINDILDISKIEAGRMTLNLEEVSLDKLFDEVYILTRLRAEEKDLVLILEPVQEEAITVRADYNKLKQVLLNIVGNATKFTDAGSITLSATAKTDAGYAAITVDDTGIGVPRDMQTKVFEKFVQTDGSVTRRHGGTGLGLTITKSLVELMGGVIRLESEGEGSGTRVTFTVPLYREGDTALGAQWHEAAQEAAVIEGNPDDPLLLIVEDDVQFRTMIERLAHQEGFSTTHALTADDAVSLARRLKPAAISLDHALLVSDHAALTSGWEAYAILRTDQATADIPVLFVTGHDSHLRELVEGTPSIAPPRFVLKPFDSQEFTAALREATGVAQPVPDSQP
jgi:signal transduction histidine kinase